MKVKPQSFAEKKKKKALVLPVRAAHTHTAAASSHAGLSCRWREGRTCPSATGADETASPPMPKSGVAQARHARHTTAPAAPGFSPTTEVVETGPPRHKTTHTRTSSLETCSRIGLYTQNLYLNPVQQDEHRTLPAISRMIPAKIIFLLRDESSLYLRKTWLLIHN